jgi:hypothetical protein
MVVTQVVMDLPAGAENDLKGCFWTKYLDKSNNFYRFSGNRPKK